jgi:hypothetical protein
VDEEPVQQLGSAKIVTTSGRVSDKRDAQSYAISKDESAFLPEDPKTTITNPHMVS